MNDRRVKAAEVNFRVKAAEVINYGDVSSKGRGSQRRRECADGARGARGAGGRRQRVAEHPDRNRARRRAGPLPAPSPPLPPESGGSAPGPRAANNPRGAAQGLGGIPAEWRAGLKEGCAPRLAPPRPAEPRSDAPHRAPRQLAARREACSRPHRRSHRTGGNGGVTAG